MGGLGEEDPAVGLVRASEGLGSPKKEKKEKKEIKVAVGRMGWVSLKQTCLITVPRWGAGHGVMFPSRREGISNCGLAVAATPAG